LSWPTASLGDVATFINGDRGKNYPSKGSFISEGIPFISAGNLSNGELKPSSFNYISEECFNLLSNGKVIDNDILFCLRGSLGKFAVVKNIVNGAIASSLVIIRNNQKIDLNFLKHYLGSPLCQREINQFENGAAQPNLSAKDLKNFKIPLPPLTEQKRIAAILDKADAIRRKRQQAIQLADDFLRAVFLDMFGDPVTNPKGWEKKNLKDIARIQIGPFGTQLHKEDYITDGVPLINPSHIINSNIVPKRNLTVRADKCNDLPQYKLELDDIILGRRGEMGRAAIVSEKEIGWLCGTGSLFIRTTQKGAFAFYLHKFLTSDYMKNYLISESLGATMPNLNKTIVGNIQIPIPSEEALLKFQKILNVNKQLRVRMGGADKNLFVSLSQKAFRGDL
tara:strand:- start:4206 stop:5387 length:1182 start_codon:yes stop_codon:yes gene_type:complete